MAARIIGEAAVRLRADRTGLAEQMTRIVREALDTATADAESARSPLDVVEKNSDRAGSRIRSIFKSTFDAVGGMASSAMNVALSGARLLSLGAAAGAALPAVGALSAGLIALVGSAAQAGGVVGLLPAALLAVKVGTATVQLGLMGMGDAMSAIASGDAAAFDEALKKLAPSARFFAQEVRTLKPAFDAMQLDVQERLFDGLGRQVKLLGEKYLPIARETFTGVADSINLAALDLGEFLQRGENVSRVDLAASNVRGTFAALRGALVPAVSALLDLTSVGSQFLPGLAEQVTGLSTRFGEFIRSAADSGQLAAFFANAISVAGQLGAILGNIGGILGEVFAAGQATGDGLLNNLVKLTGAAREFLGSFEGQEALAAFFGSVGTVGEALFPVLRELALLIGGDIAPLLGNLAEGIGPGVVAIIGQLRETVTAATPGITALGAAFGQILTAIAPILPTVGQLIGQLAGGLAAALTAAIGPLTTFINYLVSSPETLAALVAGIGAAALAFGPLSGIISTVAPIIGQLVSNAGGLRAVLMALTGPVGIVIGLITALFIGSEDFRNAVLGLLEVVGGLVGQLVSTLAPTLGQLADIVGSLVSQLGTALAPVITLVADLLSALLPPVIEALKPIIESVVPIIQQIADVFSTVIQAITPFIDLLVSLLIPQIEALLPVVETVFGVIADVISNAMDVMKGTIDIVMGILTGDWSRAWDGIKQVLSAAWELIKSIVSGAIEIVKSIFTGLWNSLTGVVRTAWDSIGGAVSSGIDNVISFVRGLPNQILTALGNFGSLLLNAGRDLINGLIEGVKQVAGRIAESVLAPIRDSVEKVKNFLGISSPSRLFKQLGVWTGEGYVDGITAMTPAVSAAGAAMAQAAADAFPSDGGGLGTPGLAVTGAAGSALAGGVTINQTNVMRPGTDVQQFANYTNREAQWDLLSSGTLLTVTPNSPTFGVPGNGLTPTLGGF